ncbi:MAG: ATP-binding cassette domain-containing protein [Verrucomicrobiota bacterium]
MTTDQPAAGSAIMARGITRTYDTSRGVLDIDLDLHWTEVVSVIGPNGCGKTTLLRCLSGFEPLEKGSVLIAQRHHLRPHPQVPTETDLNDLRGQTLGIVFQHYTLFPHFTVRQNLEFAIRHGGGDSNPASNGNMVDEMIERFELSERLRHLPHQLSGGLRQRVALARCLLLRPRILMLDEVTSGLDPDWAERVGRLISDFARSNGAVINVSHQIGLVKAVSHRILFFHEGRIIWSGAPTEIAESRIPVIEKFLLTA